MRTERDQGLKTGTPTSSPPASSSSAASVHARRSLATRREFVSALKAELPAALAHLQSGNIAPVDLAQAAIGPGMAVYTRYAKVLDAQGDPVSVRDALALINQTLDEVLAEQEGEFDADTRWALAWFEQQGFTVPASTAWPRPCPPRRTPASPAWRRRASWSRRPARCACSARRNCREDWDPAADRRLPVWEVVHHLLRVLDTDGETGAAHLVQATRRRRRNRPRARLPPVRCWPNARTAPPRRCPTTPWSRAGRRSPAWPSRRHQPSRAACSAMGIQDSTVRSDPYARDLRTDMGFVAPSELRFDMKNPRFRGQRVLGPRRKSWNTWWTKVDVDELLQSILSTGYVDFEPVVVLREGNDGPRRKSPVSSIAPAERMKRLRERSERSVLPDIPEPMSSSREDSGQVGKREERSTSFCRLQAHQRTLQVGRAREGEVRGRVVRRGWGDRDGQPYPRRQPQYSPADRQWMVRLEGKLPTTASKWNIVPRHDSLFPISTRP